MAIAGPADDARRGRLEGKLFAATIGLGNGQGNDCRHDNLLSLPDRCKAAVLFWADKGSGAPGGRLREMRCIGE